MLTKIFLRGGHSNLLSTRDTTKRVKTSRVMDTQQIYQTIIEQINQTQEEEIDCILTVDTH